MPTVPELLRTKTIAIGPLRDTADLGAVRPPAMNSLVLSEVQGRIVNDLVSLVGRVTLVAETEKPDLYLGVWAGSHEFGRYAPDSHRHRLFLALSGRDPTGALARIGTVNVDIDEALLSELDDGGVLRLLKRMATEGLRQLCASGPFQGSLRLDDGSHVAYHRRDLALGVLTDPESPRAPNRD